jgi:hypothetical protein
MLQKNTHQQFGENVSPLQFSPEDGLAFFARNGWKPLEVRSMLKTATGLKRLSIGMLLTSPFAQLARLCVH